MRSDQRRAVRRASETVKRSEHVEVAREALRVTGVPETDVVTCRCGQKNRVDILRLTTDRREWLYDGRGSDLPEAMSGRCRSRLDT
jgi:hypothetical protein